MSKICSTFTALNKKNMEKLALIYTVKGYYRFTEAVINLKSTNVHDAINEVANVKVEGDISSEYFFIQDIENGNILAEVKCSIQQDGSYDISALANKENWKIF